MVAGGHQALGTKSTLSLEGIGAAVVNKVAIKTMALRVKVMVTESENFIV